MVRRTWLFLLALTSFGKTLDEEVKAVIAPTSITVSIYAKNLDSGTSYGLRENSPVRTASTIKLPILAAVFAAVEAKEARWEETLPITPEERVSGSGVLREFSDGVRLPLRDVARMMIVVSDNTATNMILERFGGDRVNAQLEKWGFEQTRSMRKILGDGQALKPVPSGLSEEGRKAANAKWGIGRSTPKEMVDLLERLERGEIVSAAASKEMLAILKRQQYKDGIGRFLQGKFPIASKSGALDHLRSDVGIVYTPGGRIAIAITAEDVPTVDYSAENDGNKLIGKLAELLVEKLATSRTRP